MTAMLSQILQKIDKMPEPPRASLHAINMLEDQNVPISKVAEFINMDQGLASQLLKLANSAEYGHSGRVSTVQEAMMRVGTDNVKCFLYSSMLENVGFHPSPFYKELWKSALFSAFVAKEVGEWFGHPRIDLCFTGGLLCDVGQIMLHDFAPKAYFNMMQLVRRKKFDLIQTEFQVFGVTHVQVGYKMADLWKLPVVYQNVIRYHHAPIDCYNRVLLSDYRIIVAIYIASSLSPLFGDQSGALINMEALHRAGLNQSHQQLVRGIQQKLPRFYTDINRIVGSMFSKG